MDAATTSSPNWRAVLGELLKPTVSATVFVTAAATIALYAYLQEIGWPELLQPSLASYNGLALISVALVIVSVAFLGTCYGSAFWIHCAVHTYSGPTAIPRRLGLFIIGLHTIWVAELVAISFGSKWREEADLIILQKWAIWLYEHIPASGATFICIGLIASAALHHRARCHHSDAKLKPADKVKRLFADAWCGVQLAYASISSSLTSWALLALNPNMGAGEMSLEAGLFMSALTLPGIVVGLTYLNSYRNSGDAKSGLRDAGKVVGILAVGACAIFPSFTVGPLNLLSLGAISIYSNSPHTYQLMILNARPIYEMAGFSVSGGEVATLTGYERYRFGEALLVCAAPYDPLRIRVAPDGASSDRAQKRERGGCVNVRSGELRRFEPRSTG